MTTGRSRYRIPDTQWTIHRRDDGAVYIEEWTAINGTHVGVVRTVVIKAADWVDAVVHVSAFGELSSKERAGARAVAANMHRGD